MNDLIIYRVHKVSLQFQKFITKTSGNYYKMTRIYLSFFLASFMTFALLNVVALPVWQQYG